MSKRAEEISASAILPESIISYAKEHSVLSGLIYREGVKYGYEQAEKDLALTWEDIYQIIYDYINISRSPEFQHQEYVEPKLLCEEVLRRVNEQRKKQ